MIRRHRNAETRAYPGPARSGADPVTVCPADEVLERVAASASRRALASALANLSAADQDTLLQLLGEGEVLTSPVKGEGPAGTVIAATAQLSATVVGHLPSHGR